MHWEVEPMEDPGLFAHQVVSHRGARVPGRRPLWVVVAAATHATGAAIALLIPLLVLESVPAPKAVDFIVPPLRMRDPAPRGHGRSSTVGPRLTHRQVNGQPAPPANRPAPDTRPVPIRPPEAAEPLSTMPHAGAVPATDVGNGSGLAGEGGPGDPDGCEGCTGSGPGDGPGDRDGVWRSQFGEDVLDPWTPNLVQAVLIPASRATPRYPPLARRARVSGTVILAVVIRADGSVGSIEVVRGSDPRWGFDLEAIEAVKQWRYRPALLAGRPVAVHAQVIFEFTINQ
jgi:protein TonB